MALPVGKYFFARYSSTMQTAPLRRVSPSLKTRPGERDVHRLEVVAADDFLPSVRRRFAGPLRAADDRVGAGAERCR